MNSLLNDDREQDYEDMHRSPRGNDREITLGTMTILGMFFALAVLCAVFFGFGYTTGRHNISTTVQAAAIPPLGSSSYSGSGLKPSAGSTTTAPVPTVLPNQTSSLPEPIPVPPPRSAAVTRNSEPDPDGLVVGVPPPVRAVPVATTTAPVTPVTASPSTPGSYMVQVAAVSHQEDADLLVTTLKRVHYDVAVHHESQDKLLHVQVGPFATRKDADAMRQRLLGDGFNAIVK